MKTQIIDIGERVRSILDSIPPDVILIAAAKTRTLSEVEAAILAGVIHFGYNYVQAVLVEINSGREANKTGVMPEDVDEFVAQLSDLYHIQVKGLMTMGPRFGDPEDSRPYFQATRKSFERLASKNLPNITMHYLSMGMSNSYRIAIQEGANIIRIGTKLFGERPLTKDREKDTLKNIGDEP